MKKINELTPEQEAKIPIYLKKWLNNGRKTTRIDREKTKQSVIDIYECAGLKPPENFYFFSSPLQCQLAVNIIKSEYFKKMFENTEVLKTAENSLVNNLEFKYEYAFYGNYWTGWVGFYDFILNEIFPEKRLEHENFIRYAAALQNIHMFIPYENSVFISDNPEFLALDPQGRQHGETTPSMLYEDGYSLFNLNGIPVPKWAIETPKSEIKPEDILALKNTEQRMVLMRFVGLSNFMKELKAKELHNYEGYKLFSLTVNDEIIGPYLYMKCPSSGREFLEGVGDPTDDLSFDKSITTCQDALEWRSKKASKNLMTKFKLKWDYSA